MRAVSRTELSDAVPTVDEARQFLTLLDGEAEVFTFQTFGEGAARKDMSLVTQFTDSFDNALPKLAELNSRGAGIYVTINLTDGKGRKTTNIIGGRAIWQEDDHNWQGDFPIAPSLVVQTSPGKYQRYWLIESQFDEFRSAFPSMMNHLVSDYGSDANAKDFARVMRLPGFLHNKANPHLVRLISAAGRRYTIDEIVKAFLVPATSVALEQGKADKTIPSDVTEEAVSAENELLFDGRLLASALAYLRSESRERWFRYGAAIYDLSGGSEEGYAIWDDWSKRTKAGNYSLQDQIRYWKLQFPNREGSKKASVASIYHDARELGWTEQPLASHRSVRARKEIQAGDLSELVLANMTE